MRSRDTDYCTLLYSSPVKLAPPLPAYLIACLLAGQCLLFNSPLFVIC